MEVKITSGEETRTFNMSEKDFELLVRIAASFETVNKRQE